MRPTGSPERISNALRGGTGWTEIIYRGPLGIGYFGRLESGILFRGARFGWWWRPTMASINYKLDREAVAHPIPLNVTTLRKSSVQATSCICPEGTCDGGWPDDGDHA